MLTFLSGFGRPTQRRLVVQLALLCFVAFHSLQAAHQHVAGLESHTCLFCQVAHYQPLDLSSKPSSLAFAVVVAFLVARLTAIYLVPSLDLLGRPRSRAPPR